MAAPTHVLSPSEGLGRRLLHEIEAQEESLEDLLHAFRKVVCPTPSTGIPALDALWKAHSTPKINISGRGLPLLYHIITALVSGPLNGTIVLIDLDRRFSPSHLPLSHSQLQHVHIFRPTRANLEVTVQGIEAYMLYGEHSSKDREWMGTLVNGNGDGVMMKIGNVVVGWRGWLRVERERVGLFAEGMAVEEAWEERAGRQDAVDAKGWRAISEMGEFIWH